MVQYFCWGCNDKYLFVIWWVFLVSLNFGFECWNGFWCEVDGMFGYVFFIWEVQGVVQLVFVVVFFEVFMGVGVMGFFVVFGCDCGGFGYFEEVLQFQCFDVCGVECLVFVVDFDVGDMFVQVGQLGDVFLYVFVGVEYIEVVLYVVLQFVFEWSDFFVVGVFVYVVQVFEGGFQVVFGSVVGVDVFFQCFFQVQIGGMVEYYQVEQ